MPANSLRRDVVLPVVNATAPELRRCYEEARNADGSGPSGRLTLRFAIAGTGDVRSVAVADDTLGSDAATRCVSEAIRLLHFPRMSGMVTVTLPLVFQPASD